MHSMPLLGGMGDAPRKINDEVEFVSNLIAMYLHKLHAL